MRKLFLALPLLLAACQSERIAFQFQPVAPARGVAPARTSAELPAQEPGAYVTSAPAEAPAAAPRVIRQRMPALRQKLRLGSLRKDIVPAPTEATATLATAAPQALPAPRALRRLLRQRATAGPAHTTESGLGKVALFFIAVVLGVLAGLGALVSLIPGISFFGGVGLAAAGLLVLFLLYSLLSGGGKKKSAAKPK